MTTTSPLGRLAAIVAVLAAGAIVVYLLLGGGSSGYRVSFLFQNAGQLVDGNEVKVAGAPAGLIQEIRLTDDGQAEVEAEIDSRYAPLRRGTIAKIRATSLSGIANRYIELDLPADGRAGEEIDSGGRLTQTETVTSVDLDQIFNTLDKPTRRSLQRFLKGSANMWRDRGEQANEGFRYMNPFFATSSRLFRELNRDTPAFKRFVGETSKLMTALAERRDDVSGLVGDLNLMMGAIGRERDALAESIGELPDFMRRANTTFVNLRGTLDDVDPLVEESKPVARKLQPFLRELRPFARDARPTVAGLSDIVRRPGRNNDLVELNRLQPALTQIAAGPVTRNGAEREGAFPISARSLRDSLPQLQQFRPYSPELMNWFDDFSHSGMVDANGGFARIPPLFNAFTVAQGTGQLGQLIPVEDRAALFKELASIGNLRRCPGANERPTVDDSVPFTDGGKVDCDPSQMPVGP